MPAPTRLRPIADTEPADQGGRWIGWAVYASIILIGFVFGVVVGNLRPKTIEVVKNVPVETKPEAKPQEKKELEKREPEKKESEKKEEKKETPVAKMPDPVPEMKKPEPKPEPKPEAKKPDPKPEPKTSPEPKVMAVSFEKEVLPVLRSKCLNCHGAVGKPKGGLDLRTLAAIGKGGDNGAALKAGDPKNSLIWTSIEDDSMPPDGKEKLTDKEKTLIKNWILSGGK